MSYADGDDRIYGLSFWLISYHILWYHILCYLILSFRILCYATSFDCFHLAYISAIVFTYAYISAKGYFKYIIKNILLLFVLVPLHCLLFAPSQIAIISQSYPSQISSHSIFFFLFIIHRRNHSSLCHSDVWGWVDSRRGGEGKVEW